MVEDCPTEETERLPGTPHELTLGFETEANQWTRAAPFRSPAFYSPYSPP